MFMFHSWCAQFIRPVTCRLFQLSCVSLRFVFFFCQVRLLREMKGPLTEHMEHISAGDHVTQIGSLVHELVLDYSLPPPTL